MTTIAAMLRETEAGQFVLVGGPSELGPGPGPGPGQVDHDRLVTMGFVMDCLLLGGSVYLLVRTHRAKLPRKHPLIWARTFLQVLEWLYFL